MFQNKKVIRLVISLLMAVLFIKFYLKQKQQSLEGTYGMVEVLAAARDIPPHTQLATAYLTTLKVPLKYMQPGAIMVKLPDQGRERTKGKVTIAAIPEGSQITQSNLADPSIKDTGVAPLLPPGKRGYLLRLGSTDVANLLLPGDHIDVMATFTIQQDVRSSKATYTILQNILVVAVGRELKKSNESVTGKNKDAAEGLVLTLALEPTEAERLALAQAESQGEISIVVRPHGENDIRQLPGVAPGSLMRK